MRKARKTKCENHGRRRSHLRILLDRAYYVDGEFHDDDGSEKIVAGPSRCDECDCLLEPPSEEWLTAVKVLGVTEESEDYPRQAWTYTAAEVRNGTGFARNARFVLLES